MAKKSQHTFTGLDTDTADRFMKEGSYRDALNIHIGSSEDNGMFSVENVKGNTLVSYTLPTGTNQIIGSHEDIVNKCVYYFLCNESSINIQGTTGSIVFTASAHGLVLSDLVEISGISGRTNILGKWIVDPQQSSIGFAVLNPLTYITPSLQSIVLTGASGVSGTVKKFAHSILKYDAVANTISLVYKHSRLNFNASYPITGTALINGVLHWTDGYNPPRSLDLSEASGYGTFFVEPMIDFIRIPPTKEASLNGRWVNSSGTDVPYIPNPTLTNNMNDKSYQFIYRYVYKDDSRTVWSEISATMPTGYVDARKNRIDISIINEETSNYLYFSTVIKSIEIAFKDGSNVNFKYIDRLPFPTSGTPVVYAFYNDTAYSIVDADETAKYFDSAPKIAGALASVQNRIFQGDCTEGFDIVSSDFSISSLTEGGTISKNQIKWKKGEAYDIGIVFYDRADRKSGVYKLGRVNMQFFVAPSFTLIGTPPIWATHYRIVRSNALNKGFFIQGYAMIVKSNAQTFEILFNTINGELSYVAAIGDILVFPQSSLASTSSLYKYKVLSNNTDSFGNSTIVLQNGNAGNSISVDTSSTFGPPGVQILVEIYSPSKSNTQLFYETPFKFPIKDPGTTQRTFSGTDIFGVLRLYNYVSGDVYRRNLNDSIIYHARTTISVQAISFIPNTSLSITINGDNYVGGSYTADNGMTETLMATELVNQINGANKAYKAFMFFIGKEQTIQTRDVIARFIIYSTTKGSGGNINISASTYNTVNGFKNGIFELTGTNISGAVAQSAIDTTGIIESMVCNDTITGWDNNTGRANIILQNGDKETRRNTLVRFGGRFILDTAINLVNSFDSLDQEALTNNGAVRKLIAASNNQAEGTVLLAIQENEISSMYIGQEVIKNATGGQNIVATDKVIGTVNPLQKLVGTVNPESVVQNNGVVYGFDALRGIVWRYGQDGLNFLSDLGRKAFFYQRSQYLLTLTSFKCYAGIDPYHNEYIITIPNTDVEKKTLAWSENLNRWTSHMSYVGEWYQKINTQMVSFVSGQLWLHRSNSLYNNFYGVQYKSKLKMICNQEPDITKILQIVEQKSTSQWDCTDISTPEGQSSELLGLFDIAAPNTYPQDFRKYDNTTYVGSVMRDKNTPNLQASDYPLLNGDVIRSDIFSILLENSKTTKHNLYFVNLMYVDSYKKA